MINEQWDYRPPSLLCSYDTDTGNNGTDMGGGANDPGTTGGGYGSGSGGLQGDSTGIGSPSSQDGMQFSGSDFATLGALGVAAGFAAAAGGPAAGVSVAAGAMVSPDARDAITAALEHAAHDVNAQLGATVMDPSLSSVAATMGLYDTNSVDIAMELNGGIGNAATFPGGPGLVMEQSANGAFTAIVSTQTFYNEMAGSHEGGGMG